MDNVWIGIYEHRHGTDVAAYDSEETGIANMAEMIRKFYWQEAVDVDENYRGIEVAGEEDEPLPKDPPADDRECVESYFNTMNEAPNPEFWSLEPRDVLTKEVVNGRHD